MGPGVAEVGDGVGVHEQPEPLAGLHGGLEEGVHDADGQPVAPTGLALVKPDVIAGHQVVSRLDGRDRHMDGVSTSVRLDQLADLGNRHRHLSRPPV